MRGSENACAENHFATRLHSLSLTVATELEPSRPPVIEEKTGRESVSNGVKVRPAHARMKIGGGHRAALATRLAVKELCDLIKPDAFLSGAIEIVVEWVPHLVRRLDKGPAHLARLFLVADLKGTRETVVCIGATFIAL